MIIIFLLLSHNLPLLLVSTALIQGLLADNKGIIKNSVFAYSSFHFPLPPNRNLISYVPLLHQTFEADPQLQKWDLGV